MHRRLLILVAGLVFAGVAYFLLRNDLPWPARDAPATPESRTASAPPIPTGQVEPVPDPVDRPAPEAAAPPAREDAERSPIALPPLAESDPFVRERLERFGLPPEWTMQDGLVRRFAVLADSVTRGEWPRRPLRFLNAPGPFRVIDRDGRLYADPRNARRFDADLDLLESIEPAAAARFLGLIEPLLDTALRELGLAGEGRDTLLSAIDSILEAPDVAGAYELVRPKVLYEYADPEIESLPALDKQLIRLGPKNARRLKAYLIRLRAELGPSDA